MGRKKPEEKPAHDEPRRARDLGLVVPLGVEIAADIHKAFNECRAAKRWSKRIAVEDALVKWLTAEGFWPPKDQKGHK